MTAAEQRTWASVAKGLAWRVQSASRDGLWHTVVLHPDGRLECSCEWAQNGGSAVKDCKHAAAVRTDALELSRPAALWTEDEQEGMPARDWIALLNAVRMAARRTPGSAPAAMNL